jgi:hypothetical protein
MLGFAFRFLATIFPKFNLSMIGEPNFLLFKSISSFSSFSSISKKVKNG